MPALRLRPAGEQRRINPATKVYTPPSGAPREVGPYDRTESCSIPIRHWRFRVCEGSPPPQKSVKPNLSNPCANPAHSHVPSVTSHPLYWIQKIEKAPE